ncbi:MAG: hypothetical protein AB2556_03110 [Candidatus Thiodiazotropha sp.]
MKIKKLFENWGMTGLKLNAGFMEMEWQPQDKDRDAAWELYVELLTRTATQQLPDDSGLESSALHSVYSLFDITRNILKHYGRDSIQFAKVAIIVLNQVIRPFTSHWHKMAEQGAFDDTEQCKQFREQLISLQEQLTKYMGMLAEIANIEEISSITSP